jgi:hypothetical protein
MTPRREALWRRLSPVEAVRLFRRPLPRPVDVINLIWIARFSRYRLYGVMVAPTIYLIGGSIRWMSRLDRELLGAPQAEKLLVVRYRSHRAFMAMTLNPYWLLANRFREAGVERFEASFTHPSPLGEDLSGTERALAVHFSSEDGQDRLPAIDKHLTGLGGRLVYACQETSPMTFFKRFIPSDPCPLTFTQLALFAFDDPATPDRVAADAQILRETAGGHVAVHLYVRENLDTYRPGRQLRYA